MEKRFLFWPQVKSQSETLTVHTFHLLIPIFVIYRPLANDFDLRKKVKCSSSFVVWGVLGVLSTQLKVLGVPVLQGSFFAHLDKVSAGRKPDLILVFNVLRVCSHGSNQEKAGHSRRRSLREDLSAHCLQQGPVSRGLRPHSVWELRRRHWGGQQTGTTAFILFNFLTRHVRIVFFLNIWF